VLINNAGITQPLRPSTFAPATTTKCSTSACAAPCRCPRR
jgi:hypothetical protein